MIIGEKTLGGKHDPFQIRRNDEQALFAPPRVQLGAGAAGATLIPGFVGQVGRAYADDKPRSAPGRPARRANGHDRRHRAATGAYAVQGEDELKGMQLAVEHLNEGNDLIKQIAPKVTKGVLGKQVKLVVADLAAKPNKAVQEQQVFIDENKIIAMTGSTSSAVAVALNKFAEREKYLYLVAISGSNHTTGKDCTAIRSASASMARPPPTRSARCW